ncbi:hypothetical protein D915_009640 [Fasciola hepatica]|uniref:Uncharacterized protein n=1 Tax=Fasciola hepatica TaxID=6192 RepID=A0A4E0R0R1_FASHE|nr:hypothetical protein D915_009640 [Fasciola hepatica]
MGFSFFPHIRFSRTGLGYYIFPVLMWTSFVWLGTAHFTVTVFSMAILLALSVGATFYLIRRMQTSEYNCSPFFCEQRMNPNGDRCIRCTIACGIFVWYLTMLLPVNIENKLTIFESLFYHGILLVSLLLLTDVRDSKRYATTLTESREQHYLLSDALEKTSDTNHQIIGHRYSVLLDCPIMPKNHHLYVAWLLMHLSFVYYTTNLALTSVCTPILFLEWFILPRDCTSVYEDFGKCCMHRCRRSWTFVAALYGLIGSVVFVGLLLYEFARSVKSCKDVFVPVTCQLRGIRIS